MRIGLVLLMAISFFATAVPVMAAEMHNHSATGEHSAKECDLLLKNCNAEVLDINARIKMLQEAKNEKGATKYSVDELKLLEKKLKEANETLKSLTRPH